MKGRRRIAVSLSALSAIVAAALFASAQSIPQAPTLGLDANLAVVTDANGRPICSTTTATEISYLAGVSSGVQAQLNSRPTSGQIANADILAAAAISRAKLAAGTANRVLVNGGSGEFSESAVTSTELAYLSGLPFVREPLATNRTYYVATTGSDSNDGLTVGTPFLTGQKAIGVVLNEINLNGQDVTIQFADGTYTGTIVSDAPWVGRGSVTLLGDAGTPSDVSFAPASGVAVFVRNGNVLGISGIAFDGGNDAIRANAGGFARIVGAIEMGALTDTHFYAEERGEIRIESNYTVDGDATYHLRTTTGALIRTEAITATLTGTRAFTYFAAADLLAAINANSTTYSESGTTGQRYLADNNAAIYTNGGGATHFPGDTGGAANNGAIYN